MKDKKILFLVLLLVMVLGDDAVPLLPQKFTVGFIGRLTFNESFHIDGKGWYDNNFLPNATATRLDFNSE